MIPISDYNAGIILVHRNQYRPWYPVEKSGDRSRPLSSGS
jgi:hypothetical protein